MNIILSGIPICFEPHVVHIDNNHALATLLKTNAVKNTDLLTAQIFNAYQKIYGRSLAISAASLAVEIWGHVYAEHFSEYLARLAQSERITQVLSPVKKICSVIDCGENNYDQNRWIWDLLAPFKNTIAGWL